MGDPWDPSDQDIDRLFAGKAPRGGDPLDPALESFVRDVRAAFTAPLPAELAGKHVAAAIEASRLAIDKGDPAARPASKAHGPADQASGLPKWRRRTVFSTLFASFTAKIAGVAIAATAATGGLAAAGVLPAPAQQAVSQAAATVGITLPAPHHEAAEVPRPTSTVTETTEPEDSPVTGTVGVQPTSTAVPAPNHGDCISYATGIASSLGFTGSEKGDFISTLAKDRSALSAQVASGGTPDTACQDAIDKAETEVNGSSGKGDGHGKPDVTETSTSPDSQHGKDAPDSSSKGKPDGVEPTPVPTSTGDGSHSGDHEPSVTITPGSAPAISGFSSGPGPSATPDSSTPDSSATPAPGPGRS